MPYKPTGRPSGRPKKPGPVAGERPILTDKQWSAVRALTAKPDASIAEIARTAGASRQAVHQWMSDPHFIAARDHSDISKLAQMVVDVLDDLDQGERAARQAWVKKFFGTKEYAIEWLRWETKRHKVEVEAGSAVWSVESMADGKVYTDPDAYVDSLEHADALPTGYLPVEGSPEWAEFSRFLIRKIARGRRES